MAPYTTSESVDPEDLWKWMANFEEKTGGRVLAIPHNGNLSNGLMFPTEVGYGGDPLTKAYADARMKYERLHEVTQIKGDGEAHLSFSPNDEFADFETWDEGNLNLLPKKEGDLAKEYAREAYKNGLLLEKKLGANPYKFGLAFGTDSHTGLTTADVEQHHGGGREIQRSRLLHHLYRLRVDLAPRRQKPDVTFGDPLTEDCDFYRLVNKSVHALERKRPYGH